MLLGRLQERNRAYGPPPDGHIQSGSTPDAACQPDPASSQHIQARPGTTTGAERGAAPAAGARDRHLGAPGGECGHLHRHGHRRGADRHVSDAAAHRLGRPIRARSGQRRMVAPFHRHVPPHQRAAPRAQHARAVDGRAGGGAAGGHPYLPGFLSRVGARRQRRQSVGSPIDDVGGSVGRDHRSLQRAAGDDIRTPPDGATDAQTSRRRSSRVCSFMVICSPPSR